MHRSSVLFLAITALVSPACSRHDIAPNATAPNSPTNGIGGNGDGTTTGGDDAGVLDAGRRRHDLGVSAPDLATSGGTADLAAGGGGGTGGGGTGGGGGGGTGASSPFIDTAAAIHAFLTFDYRLTTSQIPQIAPRTDFVWGSGWPTQWHAANPKTYVSYYLTWNQDTTGQNLSWWTANHPDWVMYQCDQKTPATVSGYSNLILDISNPAVQAWQLAQVKSGASQGYDGIAFDLFALDNHRSACGIFRNGQWVQLYNGTRSDAKYTADVLSWLKNMYSAMHALPKPMGLIPNYTLDRAANDPAIAQVIANVDAVLDEYATGNDGYYVTDGSWLSRMQFVEALQQAGKAYFALSGFSTLDANAIQWALASYLMTKEHHDAIYVAQVSGTTYGSDAWHNEYAAAVGAACGAMTASGGVYVRWFATGLAIVNPSSSASAQYTLPAGAYTDLYGKSVTGTVTLAPHSGLVLVVGGAPRC